MKTQHLPLILTLTALLIASFMLIGCGAKCELPVEGEITKSDGDPPRWICEESEIDRHEGVKYFTFIAHGTGARENTAESSARGQSAARAAESISNRVLSLFGQASETLGEAHVEQFETARLEIQAFRAKVQVVGQVVLDKWWALTQKPTSNKPIYHIWLWTGIPWDEYTRLKELYLEFVENKFKENKLMGEMVQSVREIPEEPEGETE